MTKTSQDNNLNYIHFLKHFYEYHTEKLKYRDIICLILKVQSLVELESVILATASYTLPLLLILFVKKEVSKDY